MTIGELEELLLQTLVRRAGGNKRRWRMAVGPVRLYDRSTHPHCNWSVSPSGTAAENAAIEQVLDDLRGRHPILESR